MSRSVNTTNDFGRCASSKKSMFDRSFITLPTACFPLAVVAPLVEIVPAISRSALPRRNRKRRRRTASVVRGETAAQTASARNSAVPSPRTQVDSACRPYGPVMPDCRGKFARHRLLASKRQGSIAPNPAWSLFAAFRDVSLQACSQSGALNPPPPLAQGAGLQVFSAATILSFLQLALDGHKCVYGFEAELAKKLEGDERIEADVLE